MSMTATSKVANPEALPDYKTIKPSDANADEIYKALKDCFQANIETYEKACGKIGSVKEHGKLEYAIFSDIRTEPFPIEELKQKSSKFDSFLALIKEAQKSASMSLTKFTEGHALIRSKLHSAVSIDSLRKTDPKTCEKLERENEVCQKYLKEIGQWNVRLFHVVTQMNERLPDAERHVKKATDLISSKITLLDPKSSQPQETTYASMTFGSLNYVLSMFGQTQPQQPDVNTKAEERVFDFVEIQVQAQGNAQLTGASVGDEKKED